MENSCPDSVFFSKLFKLDIALFIILWSWLPCYVVAYRLKFHFFLISRIVKRFNRKLCFLNTSKSRPVLSPPLPPPPPPPRKNNSNIELALKKRSKAYTCLNTHRNFITTMITSQRRARPKHCVNNLICISTYTTLKNTVETPRQTPEVLASWNFL